MSARKPDAIAVSPCAGCGAALAEVVGGVSPFTPVGACRNWNSALSAGSTTVVLFSVKNILYASRLR